MGGFRKVAANEQYAIYLTEKNSEQLSAFKNFAEKLTIESGRATKKSGKADSYTRYLCKLAVIYYEMFNQEVGSFFEFGTLKCFEVLEKHPDFPQYNRKENHFPSAAISCFRSFLTYVHTRDVEDLLIENIGIFESPLYYYKYKREPLPIKGKVTKDSTDVFARSQSEVSKSKELSEWQCEIDRSHITFISAVTNKNFVESHHLIPMSTQSYFEYSIDFADNIISLCPNCHRKIHYGLPSEKRIMITQLFKSREDVYNDYGVTMNLKTLLNFYNIL